MIASRRLSTLPRTVIVLALTIVMITGCSGGPAPQARHTTGPSPDKPECIDGTGRASVSGSHLKMGPFTDEALNSSRGPAKVWLGSTRKGINDDARLTISGPGGSRHNYTREPTTAKGFQAFYPGLLDITTPGRWTITARVGPDTLCVSVDYT